MCKNHSLLTTFSFVITLFIFTLSAGTYSNLSIAADHSLSERLEELAVQVKSFLQNDREVQNVTHLRLERVDPEGIGDANYESRIRAELETHLKGFLDDKATSFLNVSYAYINGETSENANQRIIQLSAKITIRGQRTVLRTLEALEVNNSGDVGKIVGSLVSFTGDDTGAKRLKKIEQAFEKPEFQSDGTKLRLPGLPQYAVELRSSDDPRGTHSPVSLSTLRGLPFANIPIEHTYQIVLFNFDEKNDVVVDVEIDGLSAVNTFSVDADRYPGYLVPHALSGKPGVHVIPGWLRTAKPTRESTNDNVFQFVVNELGKGAATQRKSTGEIGLINTTWYQARTKDNPAGRLAGETGVGRPMPIDYRIEEVNVVSRAIANIPIRYTHPKTE